MFYDVWHHAVNFMFNSKYKTVVEDTLKYPIKFLLTNTSQRNQTF